MIKVLIVEDEYMVRHGIMETLDWASMGCTVIGEAANGMQGYDLIMELQPDLVITDIRMPYMDGVTMVLKLREQGCRCQFIMLSAHSDFGYAQSAIRAGACDYLLKPLKDEELKKAIFRIFGMDKENDSGNAAGSVESALKQSGKRVPELAQLLDVTTENRYVAQTIQYMKQHYREEISICDVADYLNISEGYLSRVFKKETNCTFTNYLSYYRISEACELLKNCRWKIYEVAEKVGYSDTAYFSTLFKKLTGISPSEYQG